MRPDGTGGPHAFVVDVASPVLNEADHHHLARSLRLRAGDACTVSDGAGAWRPCRFGDGPELEPDGEVVEVPRPTPLLGVAFVLVKGSRPERTVAALTELGIDRLMPMQSDRSVVKWDGKGAKLDKLNKVAREAGMQSRRVWLPEVDEVADLAAVRNACEADGSSLLLAHPVAAPATGADPLSEAVRVAVGAGNLPEHEGGSGQVILAIGPEGGWSPDEVHRAGSALVRLPGRVLRAETAAVVGASQLVVARDSK